MDDKQIVELYWQRSESAINETEKKYGRYCHYIAYKILYNDADAEEIVNDTYLKAWNTIPPNRPEPLKPYLGMITRQLSLDVFDAQTTQKRGGELALILDELAMCIPDNDSRENMGESVALREALNRFVKSLSDKEQAVFVRRYWYISSVSEISDDYKLKENYVNVLLFRIRKKLKEFLVKEGFDI